MTRLEFSEMYPYTVEVPKEVQFLGKESTSC